MTKGYPGLCLASTPLSINKPVSNIFFFNPHGNLMMYKSLFYKRGHLKTLNLPRILGERVKEAEFPPRST